MPLSGIDNQDFSLNGYYLRPTIAYKATAIFGKDEQLAQLLDRGLSVSFTDILKSGIAEVDNLNKEADSLALKFITGESDNIHEVLIASEKATVALQLATSIRTKVLEAYQEIMRMNM